MKATKETRTQLKIHRAAYISSLVLSKAPTLHTEDLYPVKIRTFNQDEDINEFFISVGEFSSAVL